MDFTISEKLRTIMRRNKITMVELARRTEQTPQNLSHKFKRDNFTVRELSRLANALDYELLLDFKQLNEQ